MRASYALQVLESKWRKETWGLLVAILKDRLGEKTCRPRTELFRPQATELFIDFLI